MNIIKNKLILDKKISETYRDKIINNKILYKWKQKGLINFEMPNGFSNIEEILKFKKVLETTLQA